MKTQLITISLSYWFQLTNYLQLGLHMPEAILKKKTIRIINKLKFLGDTFLLQGTLGARGFLRE